MKVKIKKLDEKAIIPTYATDGASCFDLHAINTEEKIASLHPHAPIVFDTGLAFDIPENHVMLIFSRSGHGFKHDVRLSNCVGVIDSDYVGCVKVKLSKDSHNSDVLFVKEGDRVAQAMVLPVEQVSFEVVDELKKTKRGTGGFGSTGA